MIKEVFYIIVVLLGTVNGAILSKLCKDEIRKWRKRFFLIAIVSIILSIIIFFSQFDFKTPMIIALLFMALTSITIYLKARNKMNKFNLFRK